MLELVQIQPKHFTNPDGVFKAEFENFERVPGTYNVNVIATWYGMTGLSSTQFELKGDVLQFQDYKQSFLLKKQENI